MRWTHDCKAKRTSKEQSDHLRRPSRPVRSLRVMRLMLLRVVVLLLLLGRQLHCHLLKMRVQGGVVAPVVALACCTQVQIH